MESGHRITEEILLQALKSDLSTDKVKVISFDVSGGSNKGDNFACEMKLVKVIAEVDGKKMDRDYIVKCFPMNEARVHFLKSCNLFTKEVGMYTDILPKLTSLVSDPKDQINRPKVFFADDEAGVMVMENLKTKGYYLIDKVVGLTNPQIKLVLSQLAKLHATSYAFIQRFPGGLQKFTEEYKLFCHDSWFFSDGDELMAKMTEEMTQGNELMLISVLEEFLQDDDIVQRFKKYQPKRFQLVENMQKPQGQFNVILHNDAWCNNFMFKKNDSGEDAEVMLIDFQLSRRARPTVDLAYFFGSSTKPAWRKEHLSEMLEFYHNCLSTQLTTLGINPDIYPMEQLIKDFDDSFVFGFGIAIMHAMIQLIPQGEKADGALEMDDMTMDEEKMREMMVKQREGVLRQVRKNEKLRNWLIDLAKESAERNII